MVTNLRFCSLFFVVDLVWLADWLAGCCLLVLVGRSSDIETLALFWTAFVFVLFAVTNF